MDHKLKASARGGQAVLILCLVMLMPAMGWADDYYVNPNSGNNSNSGTEALPWLTISFAMGDASPVVPGDTVYLRGGEYNESVEIRKFGSEAGGFVTLRNYPGEIPVMNGSASLAGWTQVAADDPYLTVVVGQNSYPHPYYSNIYWTRVEASYFPAWLDEIVMLEDGVRCRIASDPDQSEGYGEDPGEFRDVHEDCYGQDAFLYDTGLTEETGYWDKKDGYWENPIVRVLIYKANNSIRRSKIERYERLGAYGQIVFTDALGYNISVGGSIKDCYRLINHPHVLDSEGEFYVSAIENVDGTDYRMVYYWPRSSGNLADRIQLTSKSRAFYRRYAVGSHLVIDGIKIFGYSGTAINFLGASNDNRGTDLIIRNCQITDCAGMGIRISYYNNVTVEGNYIRRCENRGALVTNGDRCTIKNNDSRENGSTNLSFYTVTNSKMVGNKVGGQRTAHGNGTSCYGVSGMIENLLMANNVYYACNSSFQNVKNVTLFGNIYYVDEDHMAWPVNTWPRAHGFIGYDGYFVYLHNTIYEGWFSSQQKLMHAASAASPHEDFAPSGAEAGPLATWYSYNNIFHGFAGWQNEDWANGTPRRRVNRENNIYTWYMWQQYSRYGWTLGKNEQECFIHDVSYYKDATHSLSDIFVNPVYGAGDWRPKENGPAHGTGRYVQSVLSDLGIIDNFPEYDFRKDFAGNYWSDNPSIGAFEYSANSAPPIDPDPNAGNNGNYNEMGVPDNWGLYCYNNIIKPSSNPNAKIYVDVKETTHVKVILYDSKGNEIKIFVNETLPANRYEFNWDGTSSDGSKVGSGIYMVYMESGNYKKTKKIAVIK